MGKGAHHAAVPRGQNRARAVPTRIRHVGRFCPPYSLTVRILGISAFYHDSAAALVVDGRAIAAAQEERFTRKKFDAAYPRHAIDYCLRAGGLKLTDIDHVVFYDKPFIKFERLLETYLSFSPKGAASFRMALPLWLREKLFQKSLLAGELKAIAPEVDWQQRLTFCEHHLSHAASAFYPSPFDRAVVLTLDGVGEWTTTAAAIGSGKDLTIHKEIHFPHSLGLLYSAFTYYTGFKVNSGEYKLMGLAPYGTPKYEKLIRDNLIDLKPDGSFRLNLDYFNYCAGLTMTNARFDALFGSPARDPESRLDAEAHGHRRLHPGGAGGGRAAPHPQPCRGDRDREPVLGRRRCAQLRGQRQGAARRPLSQHLGAAGGG